MKFEVLEGAGEKCFKFFSPVETSENVAFASVLNIFVEYFVLYNRVVW